MILVICICQLHIILITRLLSYTYGQTSVMEFVAGMFSYFYIFATNGWLPLEMVGIEQKWDSVAINDLPDSYGQEWVSICTVHKYHKISYRNPNNG